MKKKAKKGVTKITTIFFYPICNHHKDCFAYSRGRCKILNNTDFGTKDCVFYKKGINDIGGN